MSKILIVDDEAPIRTLLRSAVTTPGFQVFEAESANRALEIAAGEGPFDLVVTDVLMPGMDGFDLADELVRAGQARNFLFISGYYDSAIMDDRLRSFPCAGFISKPFPIAELLAVLRRILRSDGAAPSEMQRSA